MGRRLRTLIVDDEPVARELLRSLLSAHEHVEVVDEAAHGAAAVDAVRSERPDLMLLDIQMPGMDGFQVLDALSREERPAVVFVTAFDEFALRAFDVHAIDYLMKPIDELRLAQALERGMELVEPPGWRRFQTRLDRLLEERGPTSARSEWLVVRKGAKRVPLWWEEVVWIEAAANYARVHAGGEAYLLRTTLAELEERLSPLPFARIHRGALVNVTRIVSIRPSGHGDFELAVSGGERLQVSRRYRKRLEGILGRLS